MNRIKILVINPIFILCACIAIFTVPGTIISYNIQKSKAGKIPLVFSEIGQVKRNYAKRNENVPSATLYYGVVNDVAMKVFEANNEAITRHGFSDRAFAQELEFKIDNSFKVHHQISDYAKEFPSIQAEAKKTLAELYKASDSLTSLCTTFSKIWDEDHDDVYHTEWYTVTVSDGNGKSHTETRTRQVYDYTIHTYTYYPAQGSRAEGLLTVYSTTFPELKVEGLAPIILETGAENEYAIEKTREKLEGKVITSFEAKKEVIKNYQSSNLEQNRLKITSFNGSLNSKLPSWQRDRKTATSCSYRTYSHSDDGPKEYHTSSSIFDIARSLKNKIDDIIVPVKHSNDQIQRLTKDIREFIAVTLDGRKGDADQLRDDIMENAKCIYKENYDCGVDIETFQVGWVILFAFLGIIAGAGAGYGLMLLFCEDEFRY